MFWFRKNKNNFQISYLEACTLCICHKYLMNWLKCLLRNLMISNLLASFVKNIHQQYSTLSMLGKFTCFCCYLLTFFKIYFFKNLFLTETLSEGQKIWIQIRTNILSVLIWVQTVCKGYLCLFDLILYATSTIFKLCRDRSSWVEQGCKFPLARSHW